MNLMYVLIKFNMKRYVFENISTSLINSYIGFGLYCSQNILCELYVIKFENIILIRISLLSYEMFFFSKILL